MKTPIEEVLNKFEVLKTDMHTSHEAKSINGTQVGPYLIQDYVNSYLLLKIAELQKETDRLSKLVEKK